MITGRSLTGILHFVNGTPVSWFSKRQATVESATYGSELVAARIAVDQIVEFWLSLRYLGANIKGLAIMFGDNKSVVTSGFSTGVALEEAPQPPCVPSCL